MKPIFETPKGRHFFAGYYDKSPVDASATRVLAMEVDFIDRMPTADDVARIGVFDLEAGSDFRPLAETRAWNWQQGCMMQWVGPDFRRRILFNDRQEGRFVSVLLDLETGERRTLPMPVYNLHPEGREALCVDYERLFWCRPGYCYEGVANPAKKGSVVEGDGVWSMDVETGSLRRIIETEKVVAMNPVSSMKGAEHYLEHMMFNPSGTRFCVFHRWRLEDGMIFGRLLTADRDGSALHLLHDTGRISHSCWRNDDEMYGWAGMETPLNLARRHGFVHRFVMKPLLPVYRAMVRGGALAGTTPLSRAVSGDSFILFGDQTGSKRRVGRKVLVRDGHPSFRPGSDDWLVADTYPQEADGYRQQLYLFHLGRNEITPIASPGHGEAFFKKAHRCDLHPKWSFDGRLVSVDTLDAGCRSIYVYDVSGLMR